MYNNLLEAMKAEKITHIQIGELLNYRYQTISDIINGKTKSGFYYKDAVRIQRVLLPKYSMDYLFEKEG